MPHASGWMVPGELYERFLALKAELEEMGMFAPEYKKKIPVFVRRLGVVTAPTGAAVRVLSTLRRAEILESRSFFTRRRCRGKVQQRVWRVAWKHWIRWNAM